MDSLPGHLLDNIIFRLDHRSLAIMQCTNRSLQSHIQDPCFESEYLSRVASGLVDVSAFGSTLLCYHPHGYGGDRKSLRFNYTSMEWKLLGSCSGLLLLFIGDGLCVANPLTKKFRFLQVSRLMRLRLFCPQTAVRWDNPKLLGFAVNRIDRTTQSFKIVHILEIEKPGNTMYRFEIHDGKSWRHLKTTITCSSSNLDNRMGPVCFGGSLHWLRNDGSIIAFDHETEQARVIPINFPRGLSLKTFFAAGDNSLTLIWVTKEVIYVYAPENILSDPKWVLMRQIRNGVLDENRLVSCNVKAYDGKCLVLREDKGKKDDYDRVVHVYDLRADKWVVTGSIPKWCCASRDIFQFTPSLSSVVGLDEIYFSCDDKRISSISLIMGLIDGSISSSGNWEDQLREEYLLESVELNSIINFLL